MKEFPIIERSESITQILASMSGVPLDAYCYELLGGAVEGVVRAAASGAEAEFNDFAAALACFSLPLTVESQYGVRFKGYRIDSVLERLGC